MNDCILSVFGCIFTASTQTSAIQPPASALETPVRGQEASAGGLREVAHGEDAFWAMNAGRDAVTSTKQEGSFWPRDLYGAAHGAIFVSKKEKTKRRRPGQRPKTY